MKTTSAGNGAKGRPLLHLAGKIFNCPVMVSPDKHRVIVSVFEGLVRGDMFDDGDDEPDAVAEPASNVTADGIAVISINGTLVKKSTGMNALSGLTSYEELSKQLTAAATDSAVKGILLDIDSPGGECSGMFDLADLIYGIRGSKPVYAVANDSAFSAAYGLASAADQIYVTRTGGVGSVGVYMCHVDQSEYDAKEGVKYTYIFAGDNKIDGNPHAPLSADALGNYQSEVDRLYGMFTSLIARNRAQSVESIVGTQASCFFGEAALPLLADKIGTKADALAALCALVSVPEPEGAEGAGEDPNEDSLSGFSLSGALLQMNKRMQTQITTAAIDWQSASRPVLAMRRSDEKAAVFGSGKPGEQSIHCCVAPYNKLSCDLGGYRELYQPGCFRESLEANDDARVLFNHNPDYVLGRRSAGTATFFETASGLNFEANAPETQWATDLLTSMRRGDITQGSAAFFIQKFRWENNGGQKIRVIEKAKLVEASVASFAAYEASQASVVEQAATAAAETPQVLYQTEHLAARLRLLKIA